MIERWKWGGGRLRRVVAAGIPFGLLMWVFQSPAGPWWASLAFHLTFSGGLFGLFMSSFEQAQASVLAGLAPTDREEVLDAVRDGRRVAAARLAPAVIERAALWRRHIGIAARDRWFGAAIAVGATGWGIVLVRDDDVRPAVVLWVLAGLLVARTVTGLGRAKARLARAEDAERYAREMQKPTPVDPLA